VGNSEIYTKKFVQVYLDSRMEKVRHVAYFNLILYMTYVFTILIFNFDQLLVLIWTSFFSMLECIQAYRSMRNHSFKSYITDFWNILDIIRLSLAWTWIYLNIHDGFEFGDTKFINEYNQHRAEDLYQAERRRMTVLYDIYAWLLLFSTLSILPHLRMFRKLRKFIYILQTSVKSISAFLIVLIFMIFAFTNAFYMSELVKQYANPNRAVEEEFEEVNYIYYHSFKSSYQGLFG
jgi:hypothetical protein